MSETSPERGPELESVAETPRAGDQVKEVGAQVAGGALQGALQGAVVGGGAGAAVGAAKGAAVAAAKSPAARRFIAGAVVGSLLLAAAAGVAGLGAASALASAISGTSEQNTEYAIADDDVSSDVVSAAESAAGRYSLPKELVIAILLDQPEYDFAPFADRLDAADPQRQHRDLRSGSLSTSTEMARFIPKSGVGADAAKTVRDLYVKAIAGGGLTTTKADSIYAVALQWALGNTLDPDEAACLAAGNGATGPSTEIGGASWSAGQISNMKTAIGLAKTMFPNDARQAAIIALITVRTESSFQNYANDGVMTAAGDPNPGPFDASDYAELAYSLTLPHDAVGSDHASIGLMQQQATMGWGDYKESTWSAGDYKGVIGRLMNPSFTIGKFLTRLASISGWQSMDPGVVAQQIQVSDYPDRYAEHVGLASEIWRVYGASSPALAVPEATGWSGVTSDTGAATGACAGSPVLIDGKFSWPIEMRDDGTPAGFITSHFGYRILNGKRNYHSGVDYSGNGVGSKIFALTDGVVVQSNTWPDPACGEYIQIAHPDGTATGYLHMIDRLVRVGDKITAGQLIAHMGGGQPGGCTFGAHLHLYTFDTQGNRVDPIPFLAQRGLIFPADRDIADD